METDNNGFNQNIQQRPMLKKVKRPINRMPQRPMESVPDENRGRTESSASQTNPPTTEVKTADPFATPKNQAFSNPFISKGGNNDDAFNLDAYLDEETLPAQSSSLPSGNMQRRFLGEEDLPQRLPNEVADEVSAPSFIPASDIPPYLTKKILILLGTLLFFVGIISAKVLFSEEKIVRNGLQGVVVNPEVPKGRARCGVAERTQGCILYLMNPQRQEMPARDFYDLAAQLTGRQRFVIETGNMRYSNTKIRPGDIAQFNIPPL